MNSSVYTNSSSRLGVTFQEDAVEEDENDFQAELGQVLDQRDQEGDVPDHNQDMEGQQQVPAQGDPIAQLTFLMAEMLRTQQDERRHKELVALQQRGRPLSSRLEMKVVTLERHSR